jgi:adenylate cyclase
VAAGDDVAAAAARLGLPVHLVADVDRLGLLPREPDGTLGGGALRRLRLVAFARQRGVADDELLRSLAAYGDLLGTFDELAPAPADDAEVQAVLAEVALEETVLQGIRDVLGIGPADLLTHEDLQALRSAESAVQLGLPPEVLLQLLRVFADGMERLAEAENRIFHDNVHERFRAQGLSGRELLETTAALSRGLTELVEPTVLYFHRRAWARAAQHDFLRHLTEDRRPVQRTPGSAACTVVFADLSGFTPLTAAMGDEVAAQVLSRFAAAVRRTTTAHDGRVVKQIGDAFMLVFDEPQHAVRAGVALLQWCAAEPGFPPVHVGAHAGDVLFRDGDYVGAAVNLAARVASATEPMQFLVTDAVLAALDADTAEGLVTSPQPARPLKGVPGDVALSAVAPAEPLPVPSPADPVCGRRLDGAAPAVRAVGATTWRFCSSGCADLFDADPRAYVGR